jgi:hypothetical protein
VPTVHRIAKEGIRGQAFRREVTDTITMSRVFVHRKERVRICVRKIGSVPRTKRARRITYLAGHLSYHDLESPRLGGRCQMKDALARGKAG